MSKDPSEDEAPRRLNSLEDRNAVVESALDRAIERGDFDDLPGLGKPLSGLHSSSDPDWWIKQKMDAEGINGVAPAAFQLKKENAVLEDAVDAFTTESEVRDYLTGFNARVREAVMDLRDGPPVFTPPRDIDAEVTAWRERRAKKTDTGSEAEPSVPDPERGTDGSEPGGPPRRWWHLFRSR
ncbi:DnaJ family domain-containing protein [Brevibacterium limosum]|uniref:DnaJ family domain-containing protein n=1 Tax=Brevibacterium limosum TaxID=2697565 RepID=UPI0014248E65|nr:DUF1992 domain-containing protein [Brevibacterium limosum]